MIYATAQNQGGDEETRSRWWRECVGFSSESLWRQFYDPAHDDGISPAPFLNGPRELAQVKFHNIHIQPMSDGILPALAGLAELVSTGISEKNLDSVTARLCVTNFFKFSLVRGKADFNPARLPNLELARYVDATLGAFVRPELEMLRPGVILAFKGPIPPALKTCLPEQSELIEVNDPAWIKRGAGGCLGSSGEWARVVRQAQIPLEVTDLVETYLEQCSYPYGPISQDGRPTTAPKRLAARTYLLWYFVHFRSRKLARQ